MRLHNKASFTIRKHVVTTAGAPEHLGGYLTGSTTISYTNNVASADTIDDSASLFITKGFKKGDVITVTGSTSNDGDYTIDSLTAGVITLLDGVVLTTEVAGDSTTISAATRYPQDVDDGVKVAVRADSGNTGDVYVGSSSTDALSSSNTNQPLSPDSVTSMQVKDLRAIWVDANTSGDSVRYQFES